ncbi:non-ribosomal peptide synthetase [Streptomyces sp. NPDC002055]|uniref:non-ribosomal peptide synthetase n=1 Tax=Streptomyces sp. NPDC002055 TaxID=3154534 RepID=UPI0033342663
MHSSITGQYLTRYQRLDESGGLLPVTGAQRRFVLVRSLDPAGRPDVVPLFFAFPRGTVDLTRLRAAAGSLAALHPALRARTAVLRGTPVQRLGDAEVPAERVESAPGEDAKAALRRALGRWPADGPPLRLYLAEDGPDAAEEVLAVALDHAACDGQSLARITGELTAAYRDGLGPADVDPGRAAAELRAYREAVLLQLAAEERASAPAALSYWAERLRGVQDMTPAAGVRPVPAGLPTGAAEVRIPVPAGDGAALPFPALLEACRAAVGAVHGPGHVVPVGYPWGGRPAAAEPVLGCFLNTVVFPAATGAPDRQAGPADPAGDAATAWWDDLDRADTPFDEVVRAARAAGAAAWSGRMDAMLTVEDRSRRAPLRLAGVDGREVSVDGRPVRAPFAVSVSQGADVELRMVWDRALIDDTAARDAFGALAARVRSGLPSGPAAPVIAPAGHRPTA